MTFDPTSEASYDELFDEVRRTELLILDDLGAHSATPWAQEKLFQILNHRYNGRLSTVLTTNQRMEELDQRLRSRLRHFDFVDHIHISAPDYRISDDLEQDYLSTRSDSTVRWTSRDLACIDRTRRLTTSPACEGQGRQPSGTPGIQAVGLFSWVQAG